MLLQKLDMNDIRTGCNNFGGTETLNEIEKIKSESERPQNQPPQMNPETKVLIKAAEENSLEIIKMLLDKCADKIDLPTCSNRILKAACNSGATDIIKFLAEKGYDMSFENDHLLCLLPAKGDYPDVVALLLADPKCHPGARRNLPLRQACSINRIETVKLLLSDPRVDPSDDNSSALVFCCDNKYDELVKLLLAHPKITLVNNDYYCIRAAIKKSQKEIVKLLVSHPKFDMKDFESCCLKRNEQSSVDYVKALNPNAEIILAIKQIIEILKKVIAKLEE